MKFNDSERALLEDAFNRRISELRRAAHLCAGGLYQGIYRRHADECQHLLNKILGYEQLEKLNVKNQKATRKTS